MRGEDCAQTLRSFLWNLCHIQTSKEQCGPQIRVNDRVIAHFSTKSQIGPQKRRQIGRTTVLVILQCLRQSITAMKDRAPAVRCNMVVTTKIAKTRAMCLGLRACK